MNAASTHLSAEAIVAYVDHELAPVPHARAVAHIQVCMECAYAVGVQQQTKESLSHHSGTYAVPTNLLEKLGEIPFSAPLDTTLPDVTIAVDEGGRFEFSVAAPVDPAKSHKSHLSGLRRGRVFRGGAALMAIGIGLALGPTVSSDEADLLDEYSVHGHQVELGDVLTPQEPLPGISNRG